MAIGDIELLQYLSQKEISLDDEYIRKFITPVKFAVSCEQADILAFSGMQSSNPYAKNLMETVVKEGSLVLLEKLLDHGRTITDMVLSFALKRNQHLHDYLDLKRRKSLQDLIDSEGIFKALKRVLNSYPVPIKSLVDLICIDAESINTIENESDGNTLLHQLVIAKETTKFSELMEAIFQAGLKSDEVVFDIEIKNKKNKTILDLALEQQNNELISSVLLHDPDIDESQQSQLLKINIPKIRHEERKRMRSLFMQQNQRVETQHQILRKTVMHLANTNEEMVRMQGKLQNLEEKMAIQGEELMAMMQLFSMFQQPQNFPGQPLPVNQGNNHNGLFVLPRLQPEGNRIEQQINLMNK
jgi:hypothetical protein